MSSAKPLVFSGRPFRKQRLKQATSTFGFISIINVFIASQQSAVHTTTETNSALLPEFKFKQVTDILSYHGGEDVDCDRLDCDAVWSWWLPAFRRKV
jgi:hypothetical protein